MRTNKTNAHLLRMFQLLLEVQDFTSVNMHRDSASIYLHAMPSGLSLWSESSSSSKLGEEALDLIMCLHVLNNKSVETSGLILKVEKAKRKRCDGKSNKMKENRQTQIVNEKREEYSSSIKISIKIKVR